MSDTDASAFILERRFDAPLAKVWQAWTNADLLNRWYKPNPNCKTAVLRFDLRPGGNMLYEMRFGEAPPHIELWEFDVVEAPRLLQWKQMLADADGNLVENSRMPDWPKALQTTIELTAEGDATVQKMTWRPFEPTEVELACFQKMAEMAGGKGWASAFENLKTLVEGGEVGAA